MFEVRGHHVRARLRRRCRSDRGGCIGWRARLLIGVPHVSWRSCLLPNMPHTLRLWVHASQTRPGMVLNRIVNVCTL